MMGSQKLLQRIKYAGIAAKTALISIKSREAGKKYLINTIGSIPGLPAKAAQLMAMKLDIDPSICHQKLEPMSLAQVKAEIEKESPTLSKEIDTISDAAKVASIGQVHQAKLHDGQTVAIKVQYPEVRENLHNQLRMLLSQARMGPPQKYGLKLSSYQDYFGQCFADELDYQLEAQRQMLYLSHNPPQSGLIVPEVMAPYTSTHILTQTYQQGVDLKTVQKFWPHEARYEVATILAQRLFVNIFQHGLIHADPHPGNWAFRTSSNEDRKFSHEVILYDYGSMLEIKKEHRLTLLKLVRSYKSGHETFPFDALVHLGFDTKKLSYIVDRLPALTERILEPLLTDTPYDLKGWELNKSIDAILGGDKWWFRMAGPPWFLMLMRAIHGISQMILGLQVNLPLGRILSETSAQISTSNHAIPRASQEYHLPQYSSMAHAKKLWVRVHDRHSGNQVVLLSMPSRSVDCLEDLIPTETLDKITSEYDLAAIKMKAQSSGYIPQILFETQTADRIYRVWLE